MIEEWRPILNYKGYLISNLGNIKSSKYKKERFLKLTKDNNGYLVVNLSNKGKTKKFSVHQLVAMAFLNHIPCGNDLVVDHIDNDKLNNILENLQLISHRQNSSKDRKNKSSKYTGVHWCKTNKKWRAIITIEGKIKHLGRFENELDASKAYQEQLKEIVK